ARKHSDTFSDGLRLPALFSTNTGVSALGIDKGHHRNVKTLSHFHQTNNLTITFGVCHAKIMGDTLARTTTTMLTNHHHRLAVQARKTAKDSFIICISTVAMQLIKFGKQLIYIVHKQWTFGMPCKLNAIPDGTHRRFPFIILYNMVMFNNGAVKRQY